MKYTSPLRHGRVIKSCLVLVFCCLYAQSALADTKPVIKVGALLSFSGGLEQWCGYIRQGIELAASEDSEVRVEIVFEDDHSLDKKSALTAARKLIEVDKVDLLYSWTASTVPVLSPAAAAAHVPLLIGAYDHNVSIGGPFVFGAFVNYDLVPREIARFLVEQRGARRLALVMAADDWSQGFEKPFREESARLGAEIVAAATVAADEKDTHALLLRLAREKADAVLAPLFSSSLYAFLKHAREMRYPGMIHVGDGMFEENLKLAGPGAEGVYASQIWVESAELSAAFRKRYGSQSNPLQLGVVASGYDWVKHLQGAGREIVKSAKRISREALRETLATFRSQGVLGTQMYGAPPQTSGEVPVVVRDGKYVRAE